MVTRSQSSLDRATPKLDTIASLRGHSTSGPDLQVINHIKMDDVVALLVKRGCVMHLIKGIENQFEIVQSNLCQNDASVGGRKEHEISSVSTPEFDRFGSWLNSRAGEGRKRCQFR